MNQNQIQMGSLNLLSQADLDEHIAAARLVVKNAEAQLAEAQQGDKNERDAWEKAQDDFKAAEEIYFAARERFRYGDKPMNDHASEIVRARQILNFLNEESRRRAAALA